MNLSPSRRDARNNKSYSVGQTKNKNDVELYPFAIFAA